MGFLADFAGGEIDSQVYAVPLTYHAGEKLRLVGAPGIELSHGHSEFLVRLGAAYDFHRKRLTISPTASLDFVGGDTFVVVGVGFGVGF